MNANDQRLLAFFRARCANALEDDITNMTRPTTADTLMNSYQRPSPTPKQTPRQIIDPYPIPSPGVSERDFTPVGYDFSTRRTYLPPWESPPDFPDAPKDTPIPYALTRNPTATRMPRPPDIPPPPSHKYILDTQSNPPRYRLTPRTDFTDRNVPPNVPPPPDTQWTWNPDAKPFPRWIVTQKTGTKSKFPEDTTTVPRTRPRLQIDWVLDPTTNRYNGTRSIPDPPPSTTTSSFVPDNHPPDTPLTIMFPNTTNPRGVPSFLGQTQSPPDTTTPPAIDPNPPNDPPPVVYVPPPPPPPAQCPNFHPDNSIPGKMSQADTVRAITSYVNSKGYRHDPDGISWLNRSTWVPWDGVTTINPCTSTTAQLMAFIFPPPGGVNTMRGLRELFYQVAPFADNQNPTVSEIENWNIEVIRHFRRLLGFNQTTHPVYNDKCTYLKAAWAEERVRTNYWDARYPGTQDSAAGPCTLPNSSNAHCGSGFLPNPSDQTPYLCPSTMTPCTVTSESEGISNHNTDIPWGIKMSRIIGTFLASDGIGSHTGPFVGRSLFGSAWYIAPTNPKLLVVRDKWGGNLAPTCP